MLNNYKGFELFNDIEDTALRNRNRAVVLANMAEDHSKDRRINVKGVSLIVGYFNQVPERDRADVKERFAQAMRERHFLVAA